MKGTRKHVPLILCCADDGEVALVGVLDELHRQGHTPEVLMGVETDPGALTAAVDRVRGAALFVLCQSDDLDRAQTRRLSGLFSARRGPEHELITVQLQAGNGLAILPQIESALEGLTVARARQGEEDGYHMRDVIGPTGAAALRREAKDQRKPQEGSAERVARELHEEMVAAEAVLVRRKAARDAERTAAVKAARAHKGRGSSHTRPGPARAHSARTPSVAPPLDDSRESLVHDQTEPLDPREQAGDGHGRPWDPKPTKAPSGRASSSSSSSSSLSSSLSSSGRLRPNRDAAVEQHKGPLQADPRREADPEPDPETDALPPDLAARDRAIAGEVLEQTDEFEAALPTGPPALAAGPQPRPMGKVLLLLSGAGMTALIVAAATSMSGSGEVTPDAGRGIPAARSASAAGQTPGVAPGQAKASDGEGDGTQPQQGGTALTAGATASGGSAARAPGVEGSAGGAGDGGGADNAQPTADAGATPTPADGGDKTGPLTPPSPPSTDLPPAVAQAVADGRIKRSGKTLVLSAPRETMTWDEANRRCRQRKIAGLGRWRLPTRGQLGRLRIAGYATVGSFWTRQVEGIDEVYAFDAKSARSSLWLKIEPNARSLCVRPIP